MAQDPSKVIFKELDASELFPKCYSSTDFLCEVIAYKYRLTAYKRKTLHRRYETKDKGRVSQKRIKRF